MPDTPSDLFAGLVPDRAKYERARARKAPARIRYVIWFTPRSGSSWLTDILSACGRLSHPAECFNPLQLRVLAQKLHVGDLDQYIQILLRRRNTEGVFGCQLTWYQMQRCFGDEAHFMRYFDGAPGIWLIREDLVAQAVSLAKMEQTGLRHGAHSDAATRAAAEAGLAYDPARIGAALQHILRAEDGCEALFQAWGHAPLRLSYERNIAMGANHVLNAIAHHIGVRPIPPASIETEHVKLGTDLNVEFAARFRAENADMLADIDAGRAVRLAAIDRTLPDRLPPIYRGARRAPAGSAGKTVKNRL